MSSTIAQSDRHGIEAQTTAVERGHLPRPAPRRYHPMDDRALRATGSVSAGRVVASDEAAPVLAVIGTMAWLFGTLLAAPVIRRADHS